VRDLTMGGLQVVGEQVRGCRAMSPTLFAVLLQVFMSSQLRRSKWGGVGVPTPAVARNMA
jgi:hypothetical protein